MGSRLHLFHKVQRILIFIRTYIGLALHAEKQHIIFDDSDDSLECRDVAKWALAYFVRKMNREVTAARSHDPSLRVCLCSSMNSVRRIAVDMLRPIVGSMDTFSKMQSRLMEGVFDDREDNACLRELCDAVSARCRLPEELEEELEDVLTDSHVEGRFSQATLLKRVDFDIHEGRDALSNERDYTFTERCYHNSMFRTHGRLDGHSFIEKTVFLCMFAIHGRIDYVDEFVYTDVELYPYSKAMLKKIDQRKWCCVRILAYEEMKELFARFFGSCTFKTTDAFGMSDFISIAFTHSYFLDVLAAYELSSNFSKFILTPGVRLFLTSCLYTARNMDERTAKARIEFFVVRHPFCSDEDKYHWLSVRRLTQVDVGDDLTTGRLDYRLDGDGNFYRPNVSRAEGDDDNGGISDILFPE